MRDNRVIGSRVGTPFGDGVIDKDTGNSYLVSLCDSMASLSGLKLSVSKEKVVFREPESDETEVDADKTLPGQSESSAGLESTGSQGDSQGEQFEIAPEAVVSTGESPQLSWLKTIESLRFGLVPSEGLEDLTLGYSELEEWVGKRVPDASNGSVQVHEIYGPFGTGKSHMMEAIRHYGYENDYVVASVEVDGKNISLSRPKTLLSQLYYSMRAKDMNPALPALDLYLKCIDKAGRHPGLGKSRYLDRSKENYAIVHRLKERDCIDYFDNQLEAVLSCSNDYTASEVKSNLSPYLGYYCDDVLKPPIGQLVVDRPRDFLYSIVATARLAHKAGYKGLIITIDEFEVEYNISFDMRERIRDLINELTYFLRNCHKYAKTPLSFFFATIGEDRYRGDEFVNRLIQAGGGDVYELSCWDERQRATLARKIHQFYCRAYGSEYNFSTAIVEEVERSLENTADEKSGMIRAFIKRYVARLDREYGPPANGE